ncbi:K02A2.6-like [Cordylochernes scorpioides]|uniref:RNA-directed DNA polymerase n=1 Tax=Cordylochernes scorpioides TaxID=51811 RepID=A0ABY6K244_9ARAC|nr:K02A2.6-like [Cordylochernes scorpioides]
MLEHGIITTSVSPYASPITLVTKRDKSKRFCVDYRRINEIIAPDVHPLPLIENILDKLSRAKYFSSADISSAYWQVEIDPSSRHLLTFVTLDGQYEFCRLPFGMRNSPQIFERAINQIFQKYKLNFIAHYFDDFIIFSDTLEEHIQHVEKFLEICQQENIKLNYKKCEFLKTSIEFLGYTVKNGTYTPQTRNLDIINAIKPPFNQKTLQSFLGAVNVYNKFIPNYARLRTPLNNLLKKDTKWQWDDKCQQAFTALKESLTRILKQVHPDGKVHPTQYYSRALRPHERNYTISELECLAIVESIEKFRIYLSGTKFTVYSDHQALQWLKTIKNPSGRLFRWSLRLSTYDYEIQYLKGTQQHEADLLSRNPFCGFISARTIKKHQPNITDTSVAVDVNGLHTIRRKGVNRIIIPEALQHSLMNQVHSEYNHPGISQMTRLISTQYYWKGMAKSIQKFVNSCHTCQIIKRPKGKPYGTLGQIPPPQQPFDLISIDTIAGFSKYGHSKTYLHVIVDHLTRYAWAFPSKSTSTLTYIQTLKKVLQQGSPKRLLSDRAPAFTSEKFRKFLLSRGIQPLLTTSNNPQANGLIERLNATITGKLRLLYLENPKTSWTKLIKQVVQIYNQSPHTVTGFPPIFLMFNSIPPELKTHYNPFPDVQKARQLASSRTQLKHERDKQRYDKGHQAPHFEIGDLVLVKNYKHPDTGKLAPYFTGPFTIIEIISPNVVRINRPNRPLNKEDDTVHVNKLKYYTEDILFLAPQPLIPTPRFSNRARKPGEKISTYIAELKKMAEYCKFGSIIDEAIRDRLIAGIEDDNIQRKLLGEGDSLTLHKAIEIALALEAAAQDAKDLQSQRNPEVVKKIKQGNWRLKPSTTGKFTRSESYTCIRCGSKDHKQDKCPHLKAKCFNCGKIGHLGRSCLKRKPQRIYTANKDGNKVHAIAETEISRQIFKIINLWRTTDPIKIEVQINDKILSLEYDTGSAYSLISESTRRFFKLPNPCPADPLRVKLATYSGQPLPVLGTLDVPVQYQNSTQTLPLMVVGGEGPSLCGRNWMEALGILPTQPYKVDMIKVTENNLPTQLHRFRELFSPGYGVFKGVRARLLVDPEVKPRFFKLRPIPYALKEKISRELDRLVKAGILKPVRHAEWAAPIVPVLKSDQTIRICGDFKITANQALKVDQYPLHKAEDIFAALAGGEKFSKIDLRDAYNQLELDDESQLYTVINTHQESKLRKDKCSFLAPSLEYLGHKIAKEGLQLLPSKVEAIQGAPSPTNLTELRAFLGLLTYYSRFIPKMSSTLAPLYNLLKKERKWKWETPEERAFKDVKEKLVHSTLLVHFDPRKRQILSCDASGVGIGAVLSQVQGDNDIRPVAFASRTLTPAEKKYSQLEREALGIVFGVTRFRNYLLGNSFTLRTDHKPLVTLFSENKGIPTIAANRIQRWAIILSAYQYKIEYIKGTSNTEADVLSRLPMFTPEPDSKEPDSEPVAMVLLMDALDSSPVTSDDIRAGLPGNPALRQALDHTPQGWSEETPKEMELMPYWSRRYELGACEGLLFWGNRVIIPTNLRAKMLDELHNSHQGIVGLKSVARTLFWWPGLDKDIEETVRRCNCCQSHASMPPRATPVNWPPTNQPWDRVHIDHLGPFEQNLYLIVVDACTKWIEAIPVPNTSTRETIEQLRCLFARFGIPRTLVSDNGTGFTSEEFRQFMTRNGIRHLRNAPFHPSSNGLAERAVQTIKTGLKKVQQGSISQRLAEILLGYRRTPLASIGKSPSEMMFGRDIRSRLDLVLPNPGKSEEPGFKVGESVWYRTYKSGPKWDQASIQNTTGNRLVTLQTARGQARRHWDQVRRSHIPDKRGGATEDHAGVSEPDLNTESEELIPQHQEVTSEPQSSTEPAQSPRTSTPPDPTSPPVIPLRRSSRIRRPPTRLNL